MAGSQNILDSPRLINMGGTFNMDPILDRGLKVAAKLRDYIKKGNFSQFVTYWKTSMTSKDRSAVDGFLEVMTAAMIEPFRTLVLDTNGVSNTAQNQIRNILSTQAKDSTIIHTRNVQNQSWLMALKHLGFEVYQSAKHICIIVPNTEDLEQLLFDFDILMDDDLNVANFRKL